MVKIINKSPLDEFIRGAQITFTNALELYREAVLLSNSNAFSRAHFLHQISLEECAKVEILGAAVTSMLMGENIDLEKLTNAFRSHAAKNRTNAYFLRPSKKEKVAHQDGDIKVAIDAFTKTQAKFHQKSNAEKNTSLYVDFKNQQFFAPNQQITPRMLAKIRRLNERYLDLTAPKLPMLLRMQKMPDEYQKFFGLIKKRITTTQEKRFPNLQKAIGEILEEMRKFYPNKK